MNFEPANTKSTLYCSFYQLSDRGSLTTSCCKLQNILLESTLNCLGMEGAERTGHPHLLNRAI